VQKIEASLHLVHDRIETARASHFQARLQLALHPDVLHHLVLAVMLLDQIRPALAAQRRPLPDLRTQINRTRAELFPEIDRVNLQILNFDEHWNLRRPHSNYRKGPRKCAQRRKSPREQYIRIKAKNSGVKEQERSWHQL